MAIINCGKCKGMKKMIGMGMLHQTCSECNGIGFIDKKDEVKVKDEIVIDYPSKIGNVEIKVKKKPGRKPKVVE